MLAARRLGLAPEKVFVNIASYGNTSAATIPIALTEALEAGRVPPGATLVFAAFGGGLTWAAAAYRWGSRTEPLGASEAAPLLRVERSAITEKPSPRLPRVTISLRSKARLREAKRLPSGASLKPT